MSFTLRSIGLLGVLLFAGLLILTYGVPETLEQSAKGFVKTQVELEVKAKYQSLISSNVVTNAAEIASLLGLEEQKIQQQLDSDLPEKIAQILASLCGYDCEKKKELSTSIASSYLERVKKLKLGQQSLENIVQGKYLEIISNLTFDVRLFLSSNLAMFLILLLVSQFKPRAIQHLFVPGLLLLVATAASSAIYVFGQDWFYTIIYNDYMGFGYLAYIAIIFAFLMDITFNGAQVTVEIINAIANAIGSAFSLTPC